MKKVTAILLILSVCLGITITSCSSVKSFYSDNQALIKQVISIVLDELINNLPSNAPVTGTGTTSVAPSKGITTTAPDVTAVKSTLEILKSTIEDSTVWQRIDDKVALFLKSKGVD